MLNFKLAFSVVPTLQIENLPRKEKRTNATGTEKARDPAISPGLAFVTQFLGTTREEQYGAKRGCSWMFESGDSHCSWLSH